MENAKHQYWIFGVKNDYFYSKEKSGHPWRTMTYSTSHASLQWKEVADLNSVSFVPINSIVFETFQFYECSS